MRTKTDQRNTSLAFKRFLRINFVHYQYTILYCNNQVYLETSVRFELTNNCFAGSPLKPLEYDAISDSSILRSQKQAQDDSNVYLIVLETIVLPLHHEPIRQRKDSNLRTITDLFLSREALLTTQPRCQIILRIRFERIMYG